MSSVAPNVEHGKVGVQLERRLNLSVHGATQTLEIERLLGRAQCAARQRHVAAKHKVDDRVALAHLFAAKCQSARAARGVE